jgi:hypothetical protein
MLAQPVAVGPGGGSSAASTDDAAPTLNAAANAKRFMASSPSTTSSHRSSIYTNADRHAVARMQRLSETEWLNVGGLDWSFGES